MPALFARFCFLWVLVGLLALAPAHRAVAQCAGCTQTLAANSNANINLNNGNVLCINAGVTFTGTLNMNGGTVCNAGTFSPSGFNFNSGTLNNYGTANLNNLNINNGTTVNNYGDLNITGNLNINLGGTLNQYAGDVSVTGSVQVNGTWNAATPVTIGGNLTVNSSGNLNIGDAFSIGGAVMNNGNIQGMTDANGCIFIGGSFTQNSGANMGTGIGINYCVGGGTTNNGNIGAANTNDCPVPASPCGSTLPVVQAWLTAQHLGQWDVLQWHTAAAARIAYWEISTAHGQPLATVPGTEREAQIPVWEITTAQRHYILVGYDATHTVIVRTTAQTGTDHQSATAMAVCVVRRDNGWAMSTPYASQVVLLDATGRTVTQWNTQPGESYPFEVPTPGIWLIQATGPEGQAAQRFWAE